MSTDPVSLVASQVSPPAGNDATVNSAGSECAPLTLTPPEIAKRDRVSPDTVRAWISSGELRAFDVSTRPGIGRPRWRVHLCDLLAFENARTPQPPVKPARRRRKAANVVEYF